MAQGPVLLIFVDGLGWGRADPAVNPLAAAGGPLLRLPDRDEALAADEPAPLPGGGLARPIDAVLGVPGVPQSATGQTSLLAGVNAQGAIGKHLTGFPNEALRELLRKGSLLKRARDRGLRAAFLNAYRPRFFDLPAETQWRLSATTVANLAAGLPFFTLEDLEAGRCLYQEFTNVELIERGFAVGERTPAEAGGILAGACRGHDLSLFEYFQTDRAGHSQDPEWAVLEVGKLEEFLAALLEGLGLLPGEPAGRGEDGSGADAVPWGGLVLLTSDHGNLEDLSTRRHTTNPVPLLAWGEGARDLLDEVGDIAGVVPALMKRLPGRG